jgi:hypothetical protein
MLQLLSRLLPAHVIHELGGAKAVDNVRRDREEVDRTNAVVNELVGRLRSSSAVRAAVAEPAVTTSAA